MARVLVPSSQLAGQMVLGLLLGLLAKGANGLQAEAKAGRHTFLVIV